ncbi:hypothetical protein SAY87_003251 [Trapa incisa]|uniref:Uncharacterized protein n=1 Tax=Trapa incisa TaxID=236973 RepID=A0AAN7QL17_9MYRT|nr:hypothetical protein SAY87_003251 [Trapa incisa]
MVVDEAREYCFWHITAGFDSNHSLETRKRVRFLTLRFGSEYSSEIPSKSLRPSTENLNFWATHLPFSSSGVTAMDSFNILKGYGKVDPVDEQPPFLPGTRRRSVLIAVSFLAILLLTLTIGFLVGALIHESATESAESSRLTSDLTESIRAVCSVTENPDYCFSSLSPVYGWMRPDPESILKLSLVVSVKELFNASLFVKQLRKTSDEMLTVTLTLSTLTESGIFFM